MNKRSLFAKNYISELQKVLSNLPFEQLGDIIEALETALADNRQIFLAGNGGSAATASHMANDLVKTVAKVRGEGLRVIALTDNVPLLTAIGNDESFTEIFSGQLAALAHAGDVLIVITGSGNSPNILRALEVAHALEMVTIGFLGKDGGKTKDMVDIAAIVPSDDYGPIEDVHVIFNHMITAYLKSPPTV